MVDERRVGGGSEVLLERLPAVLVQLGEEPRDRSISPGAERERDDRILPGPRVIGQLLLAEGPQPREVDLGVVGEPLAAVPDDDGALPAPSGGSHGVDRKSTRLNSSHTV